MNLFMKKKNEESHDIVVRCPVCGPPPDGKSIIRIRFDDPDIDGRYCMKCLARWISQNIPRLIEKPK